MGQIFLAFWRQSESDPERLRNLAKITHLVSDLKSQFFLLVKGMGSSGLPVLNLRSSAQSEGAQQGRGSPWGGCLVFED